MKYIHIVIKILLVGTLLLSCNSLSTKTEEVNEVNEAPFVYGIDISKYQGNELDFINTKKDSLGFIIVKATEGITYTDPKFTQNWSVLNEKGITKGAYHFYRTNDSPLKQVEHFSAAIEGLKTTDLPPILDFEEGSIVGTPDVDKIQMELLEFLNELESKSGRKPIIYTNISIGNEYLDTPDFAKYTLWIANYIKGDKPDLPKMWKDKKWMFWQKTSDYKIGDITNDFDVFNGSMEELKAFIKDH